MFMSVEQVDQAIMSLKPCYVGLELCARHRTWMFFKSSSILLEDKCNG